MSKKLRQILRAELEQKGRRVAIYHRVSSAKHVDEGFSLDAQLKLCRKFAADRNWEVVAEFEEPGVSAKDDARPAFQRMIRAAKAGEFEIILTHKLDRFSRSLIDTLTYLRDLDKCGVTYVSATEQFDFTTPIGRMMLAMLAAFAEWYLNNLSAETTKGKRARAEAGYWNGDEPYGYSKNEDGDLVLNKHEAKGVRLAFKLCGSGCQSDLQIADALNRAGFRTRAKGKRLSRSFSKDTVRAMLRNKFYLGLVKYRQAAGQKGYDYFPGNHPAIIDQDTWDKAQQVRLKHYSRPQSTKSRDRIYPLSGLLYCAACQTPMRGQGIRANRYYKDPSRDYGKTCKQKMARADALEGQLATFFEGFTLTESIRQRVLIKLGLGSQTNTDDRERVKLAGQLERAKQLFVLGDWTENEYLRERARVELALAQIKPTAVQHIDVEQAATLLENFGKVIKQATDVEKKLFFNSVLDAVYVNNKKVVAIRPKPNFYDLLMMSPADPTRFEYPINQSRFYPPPPHCQASSGA